MQKMTTVETTIAVGLLLIILAFVIMPLRPQMWLYPLARQGFQAKLNFETRNLSQLETEHFIVKYAAADAAVAPMVAQTAEDAYRPVTGALGYKPAGKALIVIYPDKRELNQVFGWSASESAMGVYWGGVIQVLSPRAWQKNPASAAEFEKNGPILHEYTHLVFDYMTNGNYPRWFTEGLAQYMEYQANGYEWRTKDNQLSGRLYSLDEMTANFDDLPNKSLAYRQSLAAVRYIAEAGGEAKLQGVIRDLSAGQKLEDAIHRNLGLTMDEYDKAWREWAVIHMEYKK